MHPAAVPYWLAGLRANDARVVAHVVAKFALDQRNEVIRTAAKNGLSYRKIGAIMGMTLSAVGKVMKQNPLS